MTIGIARPKLSLLAEPQPLRFRLQYLIEPYEGPSLRKTLTVNRELVIGRDASADVRLEGRLISRKHVLVRATDVGLELQDLSAYGTLVDGVPLQLAHRRVGGECNLLVGCVRIWLQRVLTDNE